MELGTPGRLAYRLAAGEPDAIDQAYLSLGPMVLGYLRHLVGPSDAEDVLQQVFVEVWRNRDKLDPARGLEGWVLGIARKRAIDHLRRATAVSRGGGPRGTAPMEEVGDIAGEDGRDLADRYARALEVRRALDHLPAEQRQVLTLAYFDDMTQTQIAEHLDLPLGTVKARTFRGLRRLAGLLRVERP